MSRRNVQRGTSLVEIMIVLVILLIGLFLAIRVFPTGFGVIRQSGNRTIAAQLAEQQMGRAQTEVANFPQGVVFASLVGTSLEFQTEVDPDSFATFDFTPGNGEDPEYDPFYSDINRFRHIRGEAVAIPQPITTPFGSGGRYVVSFGPMVMSTAVGNPTAAPATVPDLETYDAYLRIYGPPLQRIVVNSSGGTASVDRPAAGTYYIDYAGYISLPENTTGDRVFTLTLSFRSGSNGVRTRNVVIVQPANGSLWQALPVANVVEGSETLARSFRRIATATPFDANDPYQYKLLSENIRVGTVADGTFANANLGVILFNPIAATAQETVVTSAAPGETGSSVSRSLTAYVDYTVFDWHILREDREVPAVIPTRSLVQVGTGERTVETVSLRTTLPRIKKLGDAETDFGFYTGVLGNVGGTRTEENPKDLIVFNMSDPTGQPLVAGRVVDGNAAGGSDTDEVHDYYIHPNTTYGSGQIFVNQSIQSATGRRRLEPGTKLRILYKAIGDWGVGLQKAVTQYEVAYAPGTNVVAPFPLRGAFNRFAKDGAGANAQLRFPLADRGKTIVATLQYPVTVNGVTEFRRVGPLQMVINGQGTNAVASTDYDTRYATVNLRDFLPGDLLDDPTTTTANDGAFALAGTNWSVVSPITGISVKSRVIWHDNDASNERWRVQDIDTSLRAAVTQ